MANTYVLGGSPLGLVGVKSRSDAAGRSTFNGGGSRNIDVFSYNRGKKQQLGEGTGGKKLYGGATLFSGGSVPNFWPNADLKIGSNDGDTLGIGSPGGKRGGASGIGINSTLHNDTIYDTSLLNIMEKLSKSPSCALRPQDFVYCKYLGVYPNNRLMVARRFNGPIKDNIFSAKGSAPKAVLVSWKPEDDDFLELSFGEEWIEADADFVNVLNKLGKDLGIDNSGTGLSKALNLLPLPGFTETLQRGVLQYLKVLKSGDESQPLPSGNPNIIKQAKRRKTIGYGENASGLKATISIKMTCEYEQKFISGIDPTVAFQDILNTIMIFSTSNSTNYGLDKDFEKKLNEWTANPGQLVIDVIEAVKSGIDKIKYTITNAYYEALGNVRKTTEPKAGSAKDIQQQKDLIGESKEYLLGFINDLLKSVYATVSKYRIEIMGIAHALSGSPSTPWHITLGNPLRPFFCSGDMFISQDTVLKFGSTLAFNDLPSSIKCEFTLSNARPLGMQEILAKFNAGSLRTVNVKRDFVEFDLKTVGPDGLPRKNEDIQADLKNFESSYFNNLYDQNEDEFSPPKDDKGLITSSASNTQTQNTTTSNAPVSTEQANAKQDAGSNTILPDGQKDNLSNQTPFNGPLTQEQAAAQNSENGFNFLTGRSTKYEGDMVSLPIKKATNIT